MMFVRKQTCFFYNARGKPKCFCVLRCVNPVTSRAKSELKSFIYDINLLILKYSFPLLINYGERIQYVLEEHQNQYRHLESLPALNPDKVYSHDGK